MPPWIGAVFLWVIFASIHPAGAATLLFPRAPKHLGPLLVTEFFDVCRERIRNSNPYAPPQEEFRLGALEYQLKNEVPKILKAERPRIHHADILEIDKFLRREWVHKTDPDHITHADSERAKQRALFYLADYLSDAPFLSNPRSQPTEAVAIKCLADFAAKAKTLTPETRDRLVYALVRASQSETVKIPGVGELLARWSVQGSHPSGALFSHLLRVMHDPLNSEARPPLDVVLEAADLTVKNYEDSGYRSFDDKNDLTAVEDYLDVLANMALETKNTQLHQIATQEKQRIQIVIKEKRDPIYRRR